MDRTKASYNTETEIQPVYGSPWYPGPASQGAPPVLVQIQRGRKKILQPGQLPFLGMEGRQWPLNPYLHHILSSTFSQLKSQ